MASVKKLPVCKYGNKCYRKNPDHLKNFSHPKKSDDEEDEEAEILKKDDLDSDEEKHRKGDKHELPMKETTATERPLKKRKTDEQQPKPLKDDGGKAEKRIKDDEPETDVDQPPSPEDEKENIKMKYLVEMPEDFYHFWDFCTTMNPKDPQNALKCLNLKLVGPYDVYSGKHKQVEKNKLGRRPNFLLHYRYYYDPPEFQTVLASEDSDRLHFGYFRDDPKEMPVFVASNCPGAATSKEKITPCGGNLFAAVHLYATQKIRRASPFSTTSIRKLIKSVGEQASKHKYDLSASTKDMKERQKKVVCPSFHGAGIVVPVDENEVGYRPVPETPGDLKIMMRKISEANTEKEKDRYFEQLQELITLIQFANDEGDYGEGLELGMDLFSFGGKHFHPQISILLPLAYQLLNRSEFSDIITAHLAHRRKVDESVDELLCE